MANLGILKKSSDGIYSVSKNLQDDYWLFLMEKGPDVLDAIEDQIQEDYMKQIERETFIRERAVRFVEEKQKELIKWIKLWKKVKKLDFSLENKHFFLESRYLNDFSEELISNAKSEVLVTNPYVEHCNLSNTLRKASKNGVKVRLITSLPKNGEYSEKRRQYHKFLKQDGVDIIYYPMIHAKIIVVDRSVSIISSMNFYSGSSGGKSWEAGIVSIDENVTEFVVDSILKLLEKPESKLFVLK